MTDHLHPEHEPTDEELIASAPVDGLLTAEQQAQVTGLSATQALAATFAQLRAGLGDVAPASASARESAIAAALAEFDAVHGAAPAAAAAFSAPAPVVDIATRRRWPGRVMAVAASVAVLGLVGVAALGGGSDDKKSSSTAADQRAAEATEILDVAGGGAPSTIGAIVGPADARLPIEDPQQLLALQAPLAVPEATSTNSGGATETTAAGTEAKYAIAPYTCLSPTQQFLADITYQGVVAIAARDTVTGVTRAIDEQCNVLVEVGP